MGKLKFMYVLECLLLLLDGTNDEELKSFGLSEEVIIFSKKIYMEIKDFVLTNK